MFLILGGLEDHSLHFFSGGKFWEVGGREGGGSLALLACSDLERHKKR